MKLTIKKGPVSLEIYVDTQDSVNKLQKLIYQQIPIPPQEQILNVIIDGSIVIYK